jgi:hypothetical protein
MTHVVIPNDVPDIGLAVIQLLFLPTTDLSLSLAIAFESLLQALPGFASADTPCCLALFSASFIASPQEQTGVATPSLISLNMFLSSHNLPLLFIDITLPSAALVYPRQGTLLSLHRHAAKGQMASFHLLSCSPHHLYSYIL